MLEVALVFVACGLAIYVVNCLAPGHVSLALSVALVAAVAAGVAYWDPPAAKPLPQRPLELGDAGSSGETDYAISDSCLPCHPRQHASWHEGFHRTMTQVVSDETVVADFGDLTLYFDGRPYRLFRSNESFRVELSDPDMVDQALALAQRGDINQAQRFASTIPRVIRPIVMSTGSHHYQLYWYPSGNGRELYMLPFAYLIEEQRWVPRVSVFLTPPNMLEPRKVWNRDCLPCHATGGRPLYEPGGQGTPDTRVAEVGIACEACHGPSADHASLNRNPLKRYGHYIGGEPDDSVTQPRSLDPIRAGEVCGQCHSLHTQYSGEDWAGSFVDGTPYRPGQDLAETTYIVQSETLAKSPLMEQFVRDRPGLLDEWFWPDGEIRVVGREFNGLIESPCFKGSEFSCLSCHSIHEGEPDDRLKDHMRGDAACTQCHADFDAALTDHTNHKISSEGSRCQNCHLPHTSYGLLKASRSHRVSSPSVAIDLSAGRPNACNLCHLDRSLGWTAKYLDDWYGIRAPALDEQQEDLAAAPVWLLRGDAGVRALAAWHFGWEPALEASGSNWQTPLIAPLLDDPYDAVRFIAARSMRRLLGSAAVQYDFLDPPDRRRAAATQIVQSWRRDSRELPPRFFAADGSPNAELIRELLAERDDRPVHLVE
ncbi:MAG: multiheme c-type cytochrome [Bryobacterales bacterium]|nr:multiheme c-type cytochrome [Bryobacterales bacterium]